MNKEGKIWEKKADKIEQADKDSLNSKVNDLREKIKAGNIEDIKSGKDELQKAMYDVSTKLYQQAAPQPNSGEPNPNDGQTKDGAENVYNADYKEVDPENK